VRHKRREAEDAATLGRYLREISRTPRLTPDAERELGVRIQRDRDEQAIRQLVEANLRFVVAYAKRYRGLGVPFLDLIDEGNLGLIEAARRFDPGRNVKFITYAVWWVRQAIVQALSGQARIFTLPVKLSPLAARFRREVAALAAGLDHAPSTQEIAEDLEISEAEVATLVRISGEDVSLSEPANPGRQGAGPDVGDLLTQAGPLIEDELIREAFLGQVRAVLEELDPKEREIMRLRYGFESGEPRTLQQVGEVLGLSRERVRQIEARAKEKLRRSKNAQELRSTLN
jgi:RNA polymerase primary sigma factor